MSLLCVLCAAAGVFAARTEIGTKVEFEGNRAFSTGTLMPMIGLRKGMLLSEGQLERGVAVIADFYHGQGFLDAQVTWGTSSGDTIRSQSGSGHVPAGPKSGVPSAKYVVTIREGARTIIRSVVFVTEVSGTVDAQRPTDIELTDISMARRHDFLIAADLTTTRSSILDLYRDRGFFFVECSTRVERSDASQPEADLTRTPLADVFFDIREGPVCYVRRLHVRGNTHVRRRIIDRFIGFKRGDRFSQKSLVAGQRALYASRLFDRIFVTTTRADTADTSKSARQGVLSLSTDSLDIRVDVSELAPHSVAFGAGVELLPWRALTSAEWEHLNVFGQAHDFRTDIEYSPVLSRDFLQNYRLNLGLYYKIPFVTRWAINLTTQPFAKWEYILGRYDLEYGAETGASHDFSTSLNAGLFNRLHWVFYTDTSLVDTQPAVSGITNSLGANLTLDTRNDLFAPSRGVYLRPSAEIAGGPLGGVNSFHRFTLEARYFQRVVFDHVLAVRAMAGSVLPYNGSKAVPYYEEFYLGGANSLRGYDEKSIGPVTILTGSVPDTITYHYGNILLNTNVEFRSPFIPIHFSIIKGIGGALFLDGGNVFGSNKGYTFGRYQLAAGVGLRINTPIGPIRLDYGKRITDPPPKDLGRIYFGILNLF